MAYHILVYNYSLPTTDKDQQEIRALAGKPHYDAVVKLDRLRIRIYSGIARFSLYDSTAFVLNIQDNAIR